LEAKAPRGFFAILRDLAINAINRNL
jgi:hypothetical protein